MRFRQRLARHLTTTADLWVVHSPAEAAEVDIMSLPRMQRSKS